MQCHGIVCNFLIHFSCMQLGLRLGEVARFLLTFIEEIEMEKKVDKCCSCNEELNNGSWEAKDGQLYCDHCYDHVFYVRCFGFSRTDFQNGKAGYTYDGKPLHKIH